MHPVLLWVARPWFARKPTCQSRNKRSVLPQVELLEDRTVLSGLFSPANDGWGASASTSGSYLAGDNQLDPPALVTPTGSGMTSLQERPATNFDGTDQPSQPTNDSDLSSGGELPGDAGPGWATIESIGDDRGVSDSDFLTNDTSLVVRGQGAPGTSFTLYVDGLRDSTVVVGEDGLWQKPLAFVLREGEHRIEAQIDGTVVSAVTVTIDETYPPASLTGPDFVKGTAATVTTFISEEVFPTLGPQGMLDVDRNHDGDFVDEGEAGYVTFAVAPGAINVNLTDLTEGLTRVRVRLMDRAGNFGMAEVSFPVDPHVGLFGAWHLEQLFRNYRIWLIRSGQLPLDLADPYLDQETLWQLADEQARLAEQAGEDGVVPVADPRTLPQFLADYPNLRFDDAGRVGINVRATLAARRAELKQQLQQLGMVVTEEDAAQQLVIGYLPIARLMDLPSLAAYSAVTVLFPARTRPGAVASQADGPIQADVFRTTTGATGAGIKVGVISDSVNRSGGGLASSQATGDLPSSVQVLLDASSGSDEGRAMLEIIHDTAPDASLAFHTGALSPQNMRNAVLNLAAAGCQVIAEDLFYINTPMFNDGIIGQAIDTVASQNVFYATAAGNDNDAGFIATWSETAGTVASSSSDYFTFRPGDILLNVTLADGASIDMVLQWDNAFLEGGSPLANFQVPTNLDLFLTDNSGSTIVAQSTNNNLNTDEAEEDLFYTNTSGSTQNLAVAIRRTAGPAPNKIRVVHPNAATFNTFEYPEYTGGATIYGHVAAKGAVATAAAPWYSPTTPESFTSKGGNIEIWFDQAGNRLSTAEIRRKPDITAIDGVNTTFFGSDIPQDGDTRPNFFGTSAAAPVLAGAVALLLSQTTSAPSRDEVLSHVQSTARDIHVPGLDDRTGPGLVQLVPLPGFSFNADDGGINDTDERATPLGTLSGTMNLTGMAIARHANGLHDYDWYSLQPASSGTLTVTLNNIRTLGGGDLHLRIFRVVGGALIEIGSSTLLGRRRTQSASVQVLAGEQILVWVFGYDFAQGNYDLQLKLV